jgi:hypothetical protein
LWRRPRPKLGCGAKERKKERSSKGGFLGLMGEMRNPFKVLVGEPELKGPLERHRRRCEVNIRMGLKGVR